jgi:hypothetical protein
MIDWYCWLKTEIVIRSRPITMNWYISRSKLADADHCAPFAECVYGHSSLPYIERAGEDSAAGVAAGDFEWGGAGGGFVWGFYLDGEYDYFE